MSRRRRHRSRVVQEALVAQDAIGQVAAEHWAGDLLAALQALAVDLRERAEAFERLHQELAAYALQTGARLTPDALAAFRASSPHRAALLAATVDGVAD